MRHRQSSAPSTTGSEPPAPRSQRRQSSTPRFFARRPSALAPSELRVDQLLDPREQRLAVLLLVEQLGEGGVLLAVSHGIELEQGGAGVRPELGCSDHAGAAESGLADRTSIWSAMVPKRSASAPLAPARSWAA